MTIEERSELSLAFAKVLYVNGQATDQIVAAIRRLTSKFGLTAELLPRWGELQLQNPRSHELGREAGAASKLPSASESCTRNDDGTTVGHWPNRGDSENDRPSGR
jgi:hypothetical protein